MRFTVGVAADHMHPAFAVFDALAGPHTWIVAYCHTQEWAEEVAAGLNCRHEARLAMAADPPPDCTCTGLAGDGLSKCPVHG